MYRRNFNKNYTHLIIYSLLIVCLITFIWLIFFKFKGKIDSKLTKDNNYTIKKFVLDSSDKMEFNGKINVYITEEKKVMELDLEDYVFGVLSGEMPISFELEALKAQAVAARTYGLSKTINKCSAGNGADVCDTVHCQVYKPKEKIIATWSKDKKDEYSSKLYKAVKETEGQILTYNGSIVLYAQYFSTSWGKTEDSSAVFKREVPYLKSVTSEGEEISNRYKSNVKISYTDFIKNVNSKYPKAKLSSSATKNQIKILSKNKGGSVNEIKLGNTVISGKDFRTIFNLNSANFTISFSKNTIDISCLGYGHGVGMSQWGANVMAKKGSNYIDILTHYYTGVKVEKI